jgi:uncharacterized protein YeaO (DUF488 family)
MPLKTKSIYEVKEKADGLRVLITRYYPRGVKKTHFDLWMRGASPEAALLKRYRNEELDWKAFSIEFKKQLRTLPDSKKAIQELVELSRETDVTLLCYEREGLNCHRYLVKVAVENKTRRYKNCKKTDLP